MDGDRLVVTLTVGQLRSMMRDAAREGAREALSATAASKLTKTELATALRRSTATIDRYVAGGMPYDATGTRRGYDLEACRAWLAARAPRERTNILTDGVTRKTRRAA